MSCELCNDLGYIVTGTTYTSPSGVLEQCPLCDCRAYNKCLVAENKEFKKQINVLVNSNTLIKMEIDTLFTENEELKDIAIWMTGCGNEFIQHQYLCEQRDKLLKGENDE